ncbi:MAG TPA: efflux transporter outer membrane subunit [Verrucomicrobiae bacterium]|nr:efflux transporter outer membrane subunit [Verrucomicrobiae bacterium]
MSVPTAQAGRLTVGPDYQPPTNNAPAAFRDAPEWKEATPSDSLPKGPWWEVFKDAALNALMERATTNNQSLRAALARFDQARATARIERADFFPRFDFNPEAKRDRFSRNEDPDLGVNSATSIRVPVDLSYEIDLWGRVRRSFQSARAEAQASAADFHNALLSVQAEVTQRYFNLRSIDRQRAIVRISIRLRQEARDVLQARVDAGTAPELDRARADTELASAEADMARLERQRISHETALAILTGEAAPRFGISEIAEIGPELPAIPAALPSELLERRPDVAAAERQMAAASARIGVAKAGFFPVLRLTGSAGYASADLESLFNWEGRVWSIGPSLSLPLFAGGRNRATLARSRSAFEEATATYRQQVLVAFGEVQENLSALQFLATESAAVGRTEEAAARTFEYARARYEGGIVSYLEVIESQRTLLATRLDKARLAGQRQITLIQLIKALGGGWHRVVLSPNQNDNKPTAAPPRK